jgi:hypothetical protein
MTIKISECEFEPAYPRVDRSVKTVSHSIGPQEYVPHQQAAYLRKFADSARLRLLSSIHSDMSDPIVFVCEELRESHLALLFNCRHRHQKILVPKSGREFPGNLVGLRVEFRGLVMISGDILLASTFVAV